VRVGQHVPAAVRRVSSRAGLPAGPWSALVPVVAVLAGLLFATAERTSGGTDIRSNRTNLADLIRVAERANRLDDNQVQKLQRDVAALTARQASSDAVIGKITAASRPLLEPAGLVALSGPGLSVTLNDAPPTSGIALNDVQANDTVVHQSDLQAVVNALWDGNADAVQVMGQRLVETSAIICVGNTLLLNGRVFSPPFTVQAIGPAEQMQAAIDRSPALTLYRKDAMTYGLGYDVHAASVVKIPAYQSPIGLRYAQVGS
jgi:uncharacterized protein YlxW (UPF0749 family)